MAGDVSANTVMPDSTTVGPTFAPMQHKTFFANTRYWVFFSDGTDMAYCTSVDGSSWTARNTVRTSDWGGDFSTWTDGTYVYYAYSSFTVGTPGDDILWRRGTLNSDGSITWGVEHQAVAVVPGLYYAYPNICLDSNSHAVITYCRTNNAADNRIYVTRNASMDDTWSTDAGFPMHVADVTIGGHFTQPVPLTTGKVMVMYPYNEDATIRSRVLSGNSLTVERATASSISAMQSAYDATSRGGDDVDLVFWESAHNDLIHTVFDYSDDTWESETIVQGGTANGMVPTLSWNTSDPTELYCFWFIYLAASELYYKRCDGGVWDTDPTVWFTETGPDARYITCSYQSYSDHIAVVWPAGIYSPYWVRFAALDTAVPSTSSRWYLYDSEHHFPVGTDSYLMSRELSEAEGTVAIQIGDNVTWIADVGASAPTGFPAGDWTGSLAILDGAGTCDIEVGKWTPDGGDGVFTPYGIAEDLAFEGAGGVRDNPFTISVGAFDLLAGERLACRITPVTGKVVLHSGSSPDAYGQSWIEIPGYNPAAPVPELPTVLLLGMGLLSVVGLTLLRRGRLATR
jgi:hypothetical protein